MGNDWYRVPKSEGWLLLCLIVYAVIFFLPWSYDVMILNVTLQAWGAYALHILAPVAAIMLILKSRDKQVSKTKDEARSFDT